MSEQLIKLIAFEELPKKDLGRVKITYSHPSYWKQDGVRAVFDAVYAPNRKEIEQAYEKAGKSVFRLDEKDIPKAPKIKREEITVQSPSEDFDVEAEVVDTTPSEDAPPSPSEWRELSWPKLRSLAKEYTDEPVKSKEQAEEIMLEAEAANRL